MDIMEFSEWITQKFVDWRGDRIGKGSSIAEFGRQFGASQQLMSEWMKKDGKKPTSTKYVNALVRVYGDEILEILDITYAKNLGSITIPLLGRIAAGTAIAMPQTDFPLFGSDSNITVLRDWIPDNPDSSKMFALEVEGDSMLGEGIHDGDTIIMRQTQTAENGDLVAVRIDDDDSFTLKKFYQTNGTVTLQPANSKMKPIKVPAEKVHIEGKIVISIRRWK
jgi:SOS regulatory protein LexA